MSAGARKAVVVGGGPIGLLCALLLARRRIACVLLDARPLEQARRDARLLALSRGTWELLAPLLGAELPPRAAIREVHVSSGGDFGATRIAAADFDGADLGATVLYGDLLAALASAVAALPAIEVLRPATAAEVQQRPDAVEVLLDDGTTLAADLAVHAEGLAAAEPTGGSAGSADWALLADVRLRPARADLPAGAAFERFTRSGPLALLPTPRCQAAGSGLAMSMVWCMSEVEARRRSALADRDLLGELQAQVGSRIGTVAAAGPRRAVALAQQRRERVHRHRVVALGNAAQTLHPVAGQGFNLGVRDCFTLADELQAAASVPDALARYARRRRADRAAITSLTGALPALFASRFAALAVARGAALALLDTAAPLRRELAQLLMFGVRT
ncbi:MAG: FAD-dependent monooxygenase [Burkholderiaceae bacterium]|nr:FAD-dependent monooxygenase [Burkholderiaceae bacterium]